MTSKCGKNKSEQTHGQIESVLFLYNFRDIHFLIFTWMYTKYANKNHVNSLGQCFHAPK